MYAPFTYIFHTIILTATAYLSYVLIIFPYAASGAFSERFTLSAEFLQGVISLRIACAKMLPTFSLASLSFLMDTSKKCRAYTNFC